ncbi:MAG: pentapeptide repeat-containing protein [Nitrososphaeraceae archaeon]|nr:pentapeptide repeat-containing protein [Nitrososphaeraceae archaeon]
MNEDKLNFFAKFSEFSKNIIPSLKDLISDKQFQTDLDRAGGIISLIGVGLQIYDTAQRNLETDEDRASNSLIRIVFATAKNALKNASKKYFDGEEIKVNMDMSMKKAILQNVFESFKAYYDDDNDASFASITDVSAITSFKSSLVSQLKQKVKGDNTSKLITYFEETFDALFEINTENDPDIQKIEVVIEIIRRQRQLENYLNYIITESEKDFLKDLVREPSHTFDSHYYIEKRRGLMLDTEKYWNSTDNEVQEEYHKIIKDNNEIDDDVEKIIDDFVKDNSVANSYLFIGAPFGLGKTTLAKKLASKYANGYLKLKRKSQYIPIIVLLKDGLDRVYKTLNLNGIFEKVIAPDSNNRAFNRNILLILDGLDEYRDDENQEKTLSDNSKDIKKLMEKIQTDFEKYRNLKVIVTTRLQEDLPNKLPIIGNEYLRLLPFTQQQVEELFAHYNVKLTYNDLAMISKGFSKEITNPLLAWMFSKIYPLIQEDLQRMKSTKEQDLTNSMVKSLIYLKFFHSIIEGKMLEDVMDIENCDRKRVIQIYRDEKRKLRVLSILMQICEGKLTEENVKQIQKMFRDNQTEITVQDLRSVSHFYVNDKNNDSIKFVHETFKEYLLAEYYFGCLVEKLNWINTGCPSKETVEFFKGLLQLLNTNSENVRKYVEHTINNEISLLKSFEYNDKELEITIDDVKEKIISTARNSILNGQDIILLNLNRNEDIYENSWLYKWIAIYALSTLARETYSEQKKMNRLRPQIVNLIKNASGIPHYLKNLDHIDLSYSDLSNSDLSQAILTHATFNNTVMADVNLSNSDLSDAKMINVNLSNANLSNATLINANLSNATVFDAKLTKANLTKANLSNADLYNVNLSFANLSEATLTDANLSNATLSEATLIRVHLDCCNLTRSSLFRANLSEAELKHTNLTLADLSNSILVGAKLTETFLFSATLFNADLRKSKLIDSFLSRANLLNANLSHTTILNTNLTYADISNSKLLYSNIASYVDNDFKYHNLTCSKADFTNATIESKDLINYLKKNGAQNLDRNNKASAGDIAEKRKDQGKPDIIEVKDLDERKKIGFKLLQSDKEEIMITFSPANGSNDDSIQLLEQANNYARIKVGTPLEITIERHS